MLRMIRLVQLKQNNFLFIFVRKFHLRDSLMKKIFLLIQLITLSILVHAQNKWEKTIISFEQADQKNPVNTRDLIIFTGSSAIVKWNSLQTDFPKKNIVNRGFGGAITTDLIEYADRIISVHQPKQVVIYIGDNDMSTAKKSVNQVFDDMKKLFYRIRVNSKKTRISFISIKPSPSRRALIPQQQELNSLLQNFIKGQENADFIDVFTPMVLPNNQLIPSYYVADSLHMTPKAYEIWKGLINPYLK
jgi:lysophospholipase L1-like esterase